MGGEEGVVGKLGGGKSGLPPRGRGRGPMRPKNCLVMGITPAWAGKRSSSS